MRKYILGTIISLFLVNGCSQDSIFEGIAKDSGYEVLIGEAKEDLDDGRYDQVIESLSSIYTTTAINPEVGQILASAYMGKASVDTTILVSNATSSGLMPFDTAASMLSSSSITVDENGRFIDTSLFDEILDSITNAKSTIYSLEKFNAASHDDIIQLGIASAAHLILYVGGKTSDALNPTLSDYDNSNDDNSLVPIPIDSAAYTYYSKSTDYYFGNLGPASFNDKTADGSAYLFQEDLININHAIASFSAQYPGDNNFRACLDNFMRSVLYADSGVEVTDDLIMAYTTSGLYTYIVSLTK